MAVGGKQAGNMSGCSVIALAHRNTLSLSTTQHTVLQHNTRGLQEGALVTRAITSWNWAAVLFPRLRDAAP